MNNNVTVTENKKLNEKYYYYKHKSGLDIYAVPKNHSTTYALFATKYGSIDSTFKLSDEPDFTTVPDGIAHFLEHKLFEEENGEDAFLRYAQTGASANAYTAFDKTVYLFSCTENFYESLEILLDFVTHPYFSDKSVEKEQGIIGQEIRMYEDNPGWQVFFRMLEALYKNHSVRLDIAGTIDSISKITPEILYKCYNTFYNLNNMVLCISGNVDIEKINGIADKILKPAPEISIVRQTMYEPNGVNTPVTEKKLVVSEPQYSIGLKIIDNDTDSKNRAKKNFCIDILNEVMFSSASDFYLKNYEEGVITNKFGFYADYTKDYAYMAFSGESKDPLKVFDRIKAEIERVKKDGLDAEIFEICKRAVYAGIIMTFNKTDVIANTFMDCLFNNLNLFDVPEIIAGITLDDVKRCLDEVYLIENMAISIINPL